MKLTELDAGFVSTAGVRTGLHFLCPACRKQHLVVPFANPPNGVPDGSLNANGVLWRRTGETVEDITLTPSVDSKHTNFSDDPPHDPKPCRWHGWIRNGEAVTC